MANVKDYFTGNFLKAEDCEEGDIVKFTGQGEMEEIRTPDGKTKSVLNFPIKHNGKDKVYTPNKAQGLVFMEAWGEDDENWVGKQFKVKLIKINVFGKVKDSIVPELIEEKVK